MSLSAVRCRHSFLYGEKRNPNGGFLTIRFPKTSDLPDITRVLEDTGLFPVSMLDELISPFFADSTHPDKWLVCDVVGEGVIGFAWCRPEPLADGTWNLVAIAVSGQQQGHGYGAQLISGIERLLSTERVLIVETSGLSSFDETRRFYVRCGYRCEAVIPDFWADGDDKVIYWKRLG